jgi:hypothetical protein
MYHESEISKLSIESRIVNSSSKILGVRPGLSGVPWIVNVLPEPV